MATRKSVRLAEKGKDRAQERAREQEANRDNGRRASIGDVLGVTPAKPKERNLNDAKAVQSAEAAAARLDAFAATPSGKRRKRVSKKRRKDKKKQETSKRTRTRSKTRSASKRSTNPRATIKPRVNPSPKQQLCLLRKESKATKSLTATQNTYVTCRPWSPT